MSAIHFTKMHGLGNDFIVIDSLSQQVDIKSSLVRKMSDRHRGIGCDQLLLLQAATDDKADFIYRIFNADGSEVEQCGNGARCVARYLVKNKLTDKKSFSLQTMKGIIDVEVHHDNSVTVCMGKPSRLDEMQVLELGDASYNYVFVDVGNPHIVIFDSIAGDVKKIGAALSQHAQFPEGVNVSFVRSVSPGEIEIVVYERAAGLTSACGSAACAVAAAAYSLNKVDAHVLVRQRGGQLQISGLSDGTIFMQGPAEFVFEGTWLGSLE